MLRYTFVFIGVMAACMFGALAFQRPTPPPCDWWSIPQLTADDAPARYTREEALAWADGWNMAQIQFACGDAEPARKPKK